MPQVIFVEDSHPQAVNWELIGNGHLIPRHPNLIERNCAIVPRENSEVSFNIKTYSQFFDKTLYPHFSDANKALIGPFWSAQVIRVRHIYAGPYEGIEIAIRFNPVRKASS